MYYHLTQTKNAFTDEEQNVREVGEARKADLVGTHSYERSCQREGKTLLGQGGEHMIIGKDPGKSTGFERP